MKSVMTHQFSQVPKANIPRSTFNRSHGHKTTFDAGLLIPVYIDEALPGDTFNMNMTSFARLATPVKPIMDNLYLDSFFFAVPYRLVWDNWEKFNGAQDDPGDSTSFNIPQITAPGGGGVAEGDLGDYMGIPTQVNSLVFNSLHHRAYNLIWNTWFRSTVIQDSLVVDKDDGPDTYTDYVLKNRGKRFDYFTSSLPWPQRSDAGAVTLPLQGNANVHTQLLEHADFGAHPLLYRQTGGTSPAVGFTLATSSIASQEFGTNAVSGAATSQSLLPINLIADLSSATSATINALREAFQLQKLYERDARGGTRYTEIVKAHFGVTSPDSRLQRPEFLGGGTTPISITSVPQTTEAGAGIGATPQGNLAAFGTATAMGHGFSKSFTEHCLIIGIVSVRADLTYQQGLNRMFSRRTRFDLYWPGLSHIGEQEVKNKEIFADGSANDELIFSYQERFAEYRYKPSIITGKFRSNATASLDVWHLSQEFGSLPTLSDTFIKEDPPVDRVIAITTEPHIIFDSFFDLKCARPMPLYGVPGLIDHF